MPVALSSPSLALQLSKAQQYGVLALLYAFWLNLRRKLKHKVPYTEAGPGGIGL